MPETIGFDWIGQDEKAFPINRLKRGREYGNSDLSELVFLLYCKSPGWVRGWEPFNSDQSVLVFFVYSKTNDGLHLGAV